MKAVEEVTAAVIDSGTFLDVANKLAETMHKVYYHSPFEQEYLDVRTCIQGTGLDRVQRLDDFLDPDVLDNIDLFVFPDIGNTGLQRHLRSLGKAVWGHMGATDLELYRTLFLDTLEELDLPMVHNERIEGVTALSRYLKTHKNKWVKVNRFRGNMNTWHHLDYAHSLRTLEGLAVTFGGAKEKIVFVVQDDIKSDLEVGYDGWCIDGQYPSASFQGYEKKNELYLGSVLKYEDLPEEVRTVNEAISHTLEAYGYRCWFATEVRIADGVPYFIDPTVRMPGQTGEQQLESIKNFADIIWQGANGIVVEPDFEWNFAAEATLHYDVKDPSNPEEWKVLRLPSDVIRWTKLYHYCKIDGDYHFPATVPAKESAEVGVMIGVGDDIDECLDHLTANLEALEHLPVHAEVGGFAKLLEAIEEAEKEGIPFGGRIPKPETIARKTSKLL